MPPDPITNNGTTPNTIGAMPQPVVVAQIPQETVTVGDVFGVVPSTFVFSSFAGGSFSTYFSKDGDWQLRQIESEIASTKASLFTLPMDAKIAANRRLTQLGTMRDLMKDLNSVETNRPDILNLKRFAATKILLGLKGTFAEGDVENLKKIVRMLKSYASLEKQRAEFRDKMKPFYNQNSALQFKLDTSGIHAYDLDEWKDPNIEQLNNLPPKKAVDFFRASSDPNDQRTAVLMTDLFAEYECENGGGPAIGGILSFTQLEERVKVLEETFGDNGTQKLVGRILKMEIEASANENDGSKMMMAVKDALSLLNIYPKLINNLENFEVNILLSMGPETALQTLKETCKTILQRAEELGLSESGSAELKDNLTQLKFFAQSLDKMDPKKIDLNALKEMSGTAQTMLQVVRALQPVEEKNLQNKISGLIDQIEKLPSSEQNIDPIRKALAQIDASTMPQLADRMKAYEGVLADIEKASLVRLVDAKIKLCESQKGQVDMRESILTEFFGSMVAPAGAVHAHRQTEAPYLARYGKLKQEFQEIKKLLTSGNPADFEEGRAKFQNLEKASIQTTLATDAENAALFNQISIGTGIVVISGLTAGLAEGPIALGASSILARTALSVGAQRAITGVVTYLGTTAVFTTINRQGTSFVFGPEALGDSSFLGAYGMDLLMFGAIGLAMKGVGRIAGNALEWLAKRSLAAKTGMVLADGVEGAAALSGQSFAKAALDAEKARLMDNIWADLGKHFGSAKVEFLAFQAFEYLKKVGEYIASGEKHPMKKAWEDITSPKGLAVAAAFMALMKVMNKGAEQFMEPIQAKFQDAQMQVEFDRRARVLSKDEIAFDTEMKTKGILGLSDEELIGMLRRKQDLLTRRQELVAWKHSQAPSKQTEQEYISNKQQLDGLDVFFRYFDGMSGLTGEGNPYGARIAEDGGFWYYDGSKSAQIIAAVKKIPYVRPDGIQIGRNGDLLQITIDAPTGQQVLRFCAVDTTPRPSPQPQPVRPRPQPVYATATP